MPKKTKITRTINYVIKGRKVIAYTSNEEFEEVDKSPLKIIKDE